MKRLTNLLTQIAGTAVSALTVFGGAIPPKYAPHVLVGVNVLQAVVGVLAHSYNPDGTTAKIPYENPAKLPVLPKE